MTDSAEKASYSVDTSAFLDWQLRCYPTDVFFSLLDKIDGLLKENRIFALALVKEEIEVSGGADLAKWAKSRSGLFIPLDEVLT